MFTLLVSWLLVACVPGLLMLATLGLGRLEKSLAHDTVTANDVAEFLDQAEAVDVHTLAREGIAEAMEYLHLRQAQRISDAPMLGSHIGIHPADAFFATEFGEPVDAGLPTRIPKHSRENPQSTAPRHVNRV
ncbi:hypothetical protein [Mycobacterium sp.]|uniref:hypothetical protein n=1 Tax=Mycobacterium sp. TaxID=1785 RepID=UPI003C75F647